MTKEELQNSFYYNGDWFAEKEILDKLELKEFEYILEKFPFLDVETVCYICKNIIVNVKHDGDNYYFKKITTGKNQIFIYNLKEEMEEEE